MATRAHTKGFYRGLAADYRGGLEQLQEQHEGLRKLYASLVDAMKRTVWASPGHVLSVPPAAAPLPAHAELRHRHDDDGRETWTVSGARPERVGTEMIAGDPGAAAAERVNGGAR